MKYTADQVHDVFTPLIKLVHKTISHGRRRRDGGFVILQPLTSDEDQMIKVPFVCLHGVVTGSLPRPSNMRSATTELVRCPLHTWSDVDYNYSECQRHPVIEPDILAAFTLGGPEAVESKPWGDSYRPIRRKAFNEMVFNSWCSALGSLLQFVEADTSFREASQRALSAYETAPLDVAAKLPSPVIAYNLHISNAKVERRHIRLRAR